MNDEVRAYMPPPEAYYYSYPNDGYEIIIAGDTSKLEQRELDVKAAFEVFLIYNNLTLPASFE